MRKYKKKKQAPPQTSRAYLIGRVLFMKPITQKPEISLQIPRGSIGLLLTWPGREFDQKGTAPSVEQGHCTLVAVKRYRDPHGLVDGIIFYCLTFSGHHCLKQQQQTSRTNNIVLRVSCRRRAGAPNP